MTEEEEEFKNRGSIQALEKTCVKRIDLAERGIEIEVLDLHENWRLINI